MYRKTGIEERKGDAVIARIWTGVTHADKSETYLHYLHQTGLAEYASIPGHLGTSVLRRVKDGQATFTIVTKWESMEAIKAFAGDDPEKAKYYPEDDHYLLFRNPNVEHYDIVYRSQSNEEASS